MYFVLSPVKVHIPFKYIFSESNLCTLNSEIFLVFNVALVSYRDLNLQNANNMTSI